MPTLLLDDDELSQSFDENQREIAKIHAELKNLYKMDGETYINVRPVKGPPRKPQRDQNFNV